METAVPFIVVERNIGADGRCDHAGNSADLLQHLRVERGPLCVRVVTRFRQGNDDRKDVVRIEPEWSLLGALKTLERQSGGSQQHQRQCYLCHNKAGASSLTLRAFAAAAAAA